MIFKVTHCVHILIYYEFIQTVGINNNVFSSLFNVYSLHYIYSFLNLCSELMQTIHLIHYFCALNVKQVVYFTIY